MSDRIALFSRVLISALFIVYGYLKFADVTTIATMGGTKRFMEIFASGAAAPGWLGYLVATIELLGGLAILFGFRTRWMAWALAAYVVIVTLLGHPYWVMDGAARAGNQVHFFKNLAIMGAFMLVAMTGPGKYSIDARMRSES